MSRRSTEDVEAEQLEDAPGRYRAEVRHRRGWLWEVDLVTEHTILPVVHSVQEAAGHAGPVHVQSRLERPPARLGERWANWKGRRMVAAAYRRDVREGQPWVVER